MTDTIDSNDNNIVDISSTEDINTAGSDNTETADIINPEIKQLQDKIDELSNDYKRAIADYQNLQKRTTADRINSTKYMSEHALKALIPTLDNFFYADQVNNNTDNESPEELAKKQLESITVIKQKLFEGLKSIGLEIVKPTLGEEFDAESAEIIMQIPSEYKPNTIAQVLSPGYKLHDKTLKCAQIAISKETTEEDKA